MSQAHNPMDHGTVPVHGGLTVAAAGKLTGAHTRGRSGGWKLNGGRGKGRGSLGDPHQGLQRLLRRWRWPDGNGWGWWRLLGHWEHHGVEQTKRWGLGSFYRAGRQGDNQSGMAVGGDEWIFILFCFVKGRQWDRDPLWEEERMRRCLGFGSTWRKRAASWGSAQRWGPELVGDFDCPRMEMIGSGRMGRLARWAIFASRTGREIRLASMLG
jgi:hypothetical protein